ncbi:MAG: hypothetical protein K8H88_29060 [Sandaracinaceae bacterium]|nr:hypothetical protein [Sandaracinaceae bacterium]
MDQITIIVGRVVRERVVDAAGRSRVVVVRALVAITITKTAPPANAVDVVELRRAA